MAPISEQRKPPTVRQASPTSSPSPALIPSMPITQETSQTCPAPRLPSSSRSCLRTSTSQPLATKQPSQTDNRRPPPSRLPPPSDTAEPSNSHAANRSAERPAPSPHQR